MQIQVCQSSNRHLFYQRRKIKLFSKNMPCRIIGFFINELVTVRPNIQQIM